ncbi:MAG: molybdate transport system ATP-binding protein [Thiomicrorhabdus sp.]|nr:MAG: molybdate transport system ATP-binding protein [Thiomicrorhabdus sp.]
MSLKGQLTLQRDNFNLETGSFEFPTKGLTAIFGRSGSGKTTFLRCLAGLENSAGGEVFFNEKIWLKNGKQMSVHKRQLGYVFQEANLFHHLNVTDNLCYGLKRYIKQNIKKGGQAAITLEQVTEWLGLEALLKRDVNTLSGGERQRVAIGRTLLSQPKILLMDEPMASLDLFAKRAIMPYLERLRDELAIPILYVTHSPEEVERLADFVLCMEKGAIKHFEPIELALNRVGTPLYQESEPQSVLSGRVASHHLEDGLSLITVGDAKMWVPGVSREVGSTVRLVISAQQVSLLAKVPEQSSMLNHLDVTIQTIEPINYYSVLVRLKMAEEPWPLLAKITKRSQKALGLQVGQQWIAAIKSASILN